MEDVKWLIKKYGFFIVLMVIIVITGSIVLGKRGSEKNAEEVWEPPVIIESREAVKEDESMECFAEESEEPATISPMEVLEPVSILTAEEELNLQDEAMSAAEQCMELYKGVEILYPETAYSRIEGFSDQQRKEVVKLLGEQGLVSVSDDINMENYQKMEDFYTSYISGMDAMVTVFGVQREGNIGALTFIHRNGKIQSFYV